MGIKLGVAAFAMPLNAVLACLTVKYITLPYGAAFGEGFALFWPQALNRFYDPLADRTVTHDRLEPHIIDSVPPY